MERNPRIIPEEEIRQRTDLLAINGRLLLSEKKYLDSTISCTPEDIASIHSFDQRSYDLYQSISDTERKTHATPSYDTWARQIQSCFRHEGNKKHLEHLQPLFDHIGIKGDTTSFSDAHSKILFDRYFSREKQKEGVKRFISDIIQVHTLQQDIQKEEIYKKFLSYEWVSNIFGEDTKKLMSQLLIAEVEYATNPQFIFRLQEKVGDQHILRINQCSQTEQALLDSYRKHLPPSTTPITQEPSETIKQKEPSPISEELPIMRYKEDIKQRIKTQDNIIIIGGTGCGKTIKTPQMIREIMKPGEKLIVTEPRQINTSSLATRIASESGVEVGKEIGYQHGGEKKRDEDPHHPTDTLFLTEGTLLQMLLSDDLLLDTHYVMIDEVHVRSKDTEQLLGYLKTAQKKRKERGLPDLKIIATSATVDQDELENYFDNTPALVVEGRQHEIVEDFLPDGSDIPRRMLPALAATTTKKILMREDTGDIIIFVAGIEEINNTVEEITTQITNLSENTKIIKLHAGASKEERDEVEKDPVAGERRIIIATNFAETGVTINGLRHVINTGEENEIQVDPITGFEFLKTIKQSRAGCDQRRGRVGRNAPGYCWNLFTKKDYSDRSAFPTPEIQRTNLSDLVLKMKKQKIFSIEDFPLLSSPLNKDQLALAYSTLRKLGALDEKNQLTFIGYEMASLPTEFPYARMILEALQKNKTGFDHAGNTLLANICTIAAMANEKNLFSRKAEDRKKVSEAQTYFKQKNPESDILMYAEIWNEYIDKKKDPQWLEEKGISKKAIDNIEKERDKLLKRARNVFDDMCFLETLSSGADIYSDRPSDADKIQKTKEVFFHPAGETYTLLQIYQTYQRLQTKEEKEAWAEQHGIVYRNIENISYRARTIKNEKQKREEQSTKEDILSCISSGLQHRKMKYDPDTQTYMVDGSPYHFVMKHSILERADTRPEYITSLSNSGVKNYNKKSVVELSYCQAEYP